jgi:hypothetical protein
MKFSKAFGARIFGIHCVVLILAHAHAATVKFDWHKTAFTSDYETAGDVVVDSSGSVVWATSSFDGQGNILPKISFKKFTQEGLPVWTRDLTLNNSSYIPPQIGGDSAGNIAFVAPYTAGIGIGGFLGRLTPLGTVTFGALRAENFQWYPNGSTEAFRAPCTVDAEGNCIFAIPFSSLLFGSQSLQGDQDIAIIKTSPTGAVIWIKKVVGPGLNMPTGLVTDEQSNVYLSGFSDGAAAFDGFVFDSSGGRDGFIVKYAKDGTIQWVRRPTCTSADSITGLTLVGDGTIFFTGKYQGSLSLGLIISGANTYWARIDANGNILSGGNLPWPITITKVVGTPAGNILLSGSFAGTLLFGQTAINQGNNDVFVAQFSKSGVFQWAKTLGYIYADSPGGVAAGPLGEFYVAATVLNGVILDGQFVSGTGNPDALLAKLVDVNSSQYPRVVAQPVGAASYFGGEATILAVVSSLTPVTYQWFRNGFAIPGQTSASLTIPSVRPSDDASYYVEVTNQYGTVRSDSVHLIVRGEAPIVVTTLAGTNVAGFKDSADPRAARYFAPDSPAIQNDGTIVVPDAGNHAVRLIDPSGAVGTLSGNGTAGLDNGPASVATFNVPIGAAISAGWDIFIADGFNNVVRKINALGTRSVSTYAGTGEEGFQNGAAAQAKFSFPNDLVCAPDGTLFVTEFTGHRVRMITTDGTVSTFAGTGVAGFKDGPGGQAQFNEPAGIARDAAGNLYVTEWLNHTIRKITPAGVVSTIAGAVGQGGFVDGPALTAARLSSPNGIGGGWKGKYFFHGARQ